MTLAAIANTRLISQHIGGTKFKTPKDIVQWMGAMQAQDYAMAKWAVGIRLPGSTDKLVETAIDRGEIIRTHVLRPTWHFVSADDIHWMLELTAPHIKPLLKSRQKELELSEPVLKKTNKIIEKALANGNHFTREELVKEFKRSKIATSDNRLSHIMLWAELNGIVCSGKVKDKKQTYALLAERIPDKKKWTKDAALAELAGRYFLSHCPATLQDFIWWSGLSVANAKHAVEMIKPAFVAETIGSQTYPKGMDYHWFPNSFLAPEINNRSACLLPAFDEFIISYKDRSAALNTEHHSRSISQNGIFRPVIIINGQVRGLWKRTIKKDKLIVETEFFRPQNKTSKKLIEKASKTFGHFLDRKTEVYHKTG